jgi:TolA-binding protein
VSALILLALLSVTQDSDDLVRMLQYQFEQKLTGIKAQNGQLKDEITRLQVELQKQEKACHERLAVEVQKQEEAKGEAPIEIKMENSQSKTAYQNALSAVQAEDWEESLIRMESFIRAHPKSEYADNAVYWLAQIYLQRNEIELARSELSRLVGLYPKSERAERALATLRTLPMINQTKAGAEK